MKKLVFLLLVSVAFARTRPPVDARLNDVHSVFIAGNNQAAEAARAEILKDTEKHKACFTLATNPKDADATMQLDTDSQAMGQYQGSIGAFGGRNWIVSGTLTLAAGDVIWSASERFEDAPFTSGGKVAGKILYKRLKYDVCGKH